MDLLGRVRRRYRARPIDSILELTALGLTAWILVAPFTVVRYPPITDLPMHAAVTSALRHWFDPAFHFRDQFELQPLRVPLLVFYGLGALFAVVMPIATAVKLASIAMLSTLPIGLAVCCRGLKKSPLLGVAAAGLVWGPLTQWGFLSFIGALGLTMLGVGLALHVVERPSRARVAGLGVVAVLLLFTHVSRFPIFLVALAITVGAMAESWRAVRAVVLALAPSLALFAGWWLLRPASLSGAIELHWHPDRWRRFADDLSRSFSGSHEYENLRTQVALLALVAVYCPVANLVTRLRSKRGARMRLRPRVIRRSIAIGALTAMFAVLYFSMPLTIGEWSYVFPREATAAALAALALLPALPKNPWVRAPALTALLVAASLPMQFVTGRYAAFERRTVAFQHVVAQLPQAPKLGYIVIDPTDPDAIFRPLVHLPAWVQAERGGWLSFHFSTWNHMPIRFRTDPAADLAPATPPDFEWHPAMFDVATRGKYFDWLLVHAAESPDSLVAVDPALRRVRSEGTWWLYHREPRE